MSHLKFESMAAGVAFLLTGLYALHPGPYQMAAFVFIAQPLFLIAVVCLAYDVWQDLRSREVL
jgi:hypothetical protein